jgi:GT2 family glycosyltransferase/glycosyltransferase involved in cell wall biosynthesis
MQPPDREPDETGSESALRQVLSSFFDAPWYMSRYPDVVSAGLDPLRHFMIHGALESRDPNRWFDSTWYAEHYPDVRTTGVNPLLHYLQSGASELRNPHPRFDAAWYVDRHPDAAANPLLYHLRFGAAQGFLTEKPIGIADYLPSEAPPLSVPDGLTVDVVIPVYKGLAETRRCLESVIADPNRLAGRIVVIDDASPEPALSAWLDKLAAKRHIVLLRNKKNLGFVASVNRGMRKAGANDVVLLNSDTEVPAGWLPRLAAQAYREARIASVSPFSNNATICGYPRNEGSNLPFGRMLADMDAACQAVNAGRSVMVPTTVGFCMYIRRAALDAIGLFDEAAFGRGYGEENDFCLRAAAQGWRHMLACDVFVYHKGAVSFGDETNSRVAEAMKTILARYPTYLQDVARHARLDEVGPYRIAVTASLFATSGLPVILMVCHDLGGGVRHHVDRLVAKLAGRTNILLLLATTRGSQLSVPAVPGHPALDLPAERLDDLLRLLRSAGVGRVHIHHLSGMDMDVHTLIHRLGVAFDVTVHDYFGLCPQVNLLPWLDGLYCGEPGPSACNACIADRPSHGASDILAWRLAQAWQFREADRVICPSTDVRDRLVRFGLGARAVVAPHEPVSGGPWPLRRSKPRNGKLRVALIGILAAHKGAAIVEAVLEAADSAAYEFHLIGDVGESFPDAARERLRIAGRYDESDLPSLIRSVRPHVLWFPASWPETYSYTVSAGVEAGLPIVASDLGALPERLIGRPLTWLVDPSLDTAPWLAAFEAVRTALREPAPAAGVRTPVADFYAEPYLATRAVRRDGPIDLHRPGRTSVLVVPERFDNSALTPCAYIRLLLPLDHAASEAPLDIVVADAASAHRYKADIVMTQRYALPDIASADALAAHARATGAKLFYDLDDDLLKIPRDHADAGALRPKAKTVQRMLRHADRVTVSTPVLSQSLRAYRGDTIVVPNALDERLWGKTPPPRGDGPHQGPVRILFMGTATHDADFAMIEPALFRVLEAFGGRVQVDMLGFSSRKKLPAWVRRLGLPPTASASYPGFVNWIVHQPVWDIGLAPLADTAFNRCKSAIKTLDYAALGLALLASDVAVYRGSVADGAGGMLVPNTEDAWYLALSRLVRDTDLRRRLGQGAWDSYRSRGTLNAKPADWCSAWLGAAIGIGSGPATREGSRPLS